MPTNTLPPLLVYNSNLKTDAEILAEFVVRHDLFEDLFEAIQTAKMDTPEQHYLIVGQRGMGKTTLINRLRVAIEQDENLHKWLIPVVLQEEQYQITELANLWEVVADYLEGIDEVAFAGLFDKMEANYSRSDYERFCFDILSERLRKANKKIILFIENFGEFLAKLSDLETHRLREVLMNNNQLRLFGTSTVFLDNAKTRGYGKIAKEVEGQFQYDKPFWEFFSMVRLEGLSKTEAQFLLRSLAERYQKIELLERILREAPSRVEVLRRLSGGVVRTMVLLFEIFLDNEKGSALSDLNLVLDRITPLYKHRTDDLSTQQQKIVDTIARHWDSISTKEIAERTRLESKLVSAQLKQLYDARIIEKIPTSTKNHLYQLSERFYNIWYLMRYGKRKDSSRVIWLVRFLEDWCSKDELEERVVKHIQALERGEIKGEEALFMTETYLAMDKINWFVKTELLEITNNTFALKEVAHLSKTDVGLWLKSEEYSGVNNYEKALETALQIKNPDEDILREIGIWYGVLEQPEKALAYFLKAHDKGNEMAYFDIAYCVRQFKGGEKIMSEQHAINYFEQWVEMRESNPIFMSTHINLFIPTIELKSTIELWPKLLKYNYLDISLIYATFLLRNDNVTEAISYLTNNFDIEMIKRGYSLFDSLLYEFLQLLITKKQYHAAYNLFQEYEELLKERFKPLWYALMHLMKDEFPDEYLRMPAEMAETVQEILEKVK